ncbi:hypothetical protein ACQEVF_13600 [Nonomuraea polychroma]|uniref:hypothetical protein n=1 Tax=Nonomuraea polychroma TaxID=46176 RepID=UPI003D8A6387
MAFLAHPSSSGGGHAGEFLADRLPLRFAQAAGRMIGVAVPPGRGGVRPAAVQVAAATRPPESNTSPSVSSRPSAQEVDNMRSIKTTVESLTTR